MAEAAEALAACGFAAERDSADSIIRYGTHRMRIVIEIPDDFPQMYLPVGVEHRLQVLLARQDRGPGLSADERKEAEGLVDLVELLSLLKLRAERLGSGSA